jgi:hypothetical protein
MSTYETDPAGLGVGKRYGPLSLGGSGGVTCGANGEFRYVVEVSAEEIAANPSVELRIPASYGVITDVRLEVEEAFPATDDIDVEYNSVSILSAAMAADTVGVVTGALAVSPTVVAADTPITIDVSGIAANPATGFAKVWVTLERN